MSAPAAALLLILLLGVFLSNAEACYCRACLYSDLSIRTLLFTEDGEKAVVDPIGQESLSLRFTVEINNECCAHAEVRLDFGDFKGPFSPPVIRFDTDGTALTAFRVEHDVPYTFSYMSSKSQHVYIKNATFYHSNGC